ncbi:MAG: hypothetical protein M3Z66_06250 [Chloroflexota bacterium]|nr:hypothetical protein [Chloroflexota bacterium]
MRSVDVVQPVVDEQQQTVAHLEEFEPPTPSSEVWYCAFSLAFATIRSWSLPLLQADSLGHSVNDERARLPVNDDYCGQIVVS